MLDTLAVVSFGGVVLWEHQPSKETRVNLDAGNRRHLINQLIRDVLLEDRSGMKEFVAKNYKLRWSLYNDDQFFVVAVFSKYISIPFLNRFLEEVGAGFQHHFSRAKKNAFLASVEELEAFDEIVNQHWHNMEGMTRESRLEPFAKQFRGNIDNLNDERNEDEDAPLDEDSTDRKEEEKDEKVNPTSIGEDTGNESSLLPSTQALPSASTVIRDGQVLVTKDGRRVVAGKGRGGRRGPPRADHDASVEQKESTKKQKPLKVPTNRSAISNPGGVIDTAAEEQHRRGSAGPSNEELEAQANAQKALYIKRLADGAVAPVNEKDWGEENSSEKRNRLSSWLRSYVGGSRDVEEGDLEKVLPQLREKLMSKNVNVEVTEDVCRSVEASLKGKKLGTFESIYSVVEKAMMSSLHRILQPKREVNILREISSVKQQHKPYVIVLCGVNGVGKSTSLAKIAYWLQANQYSVLIAAADTFRHGAVEQLQIHGRCLSVEVFQQGYGTDPSVVAAGAIVAASRQHVDVVLIDTAGRQQNHTSRMRALAKLIHDNQPHLVLFVGEALVGNTGVDQLRRFNQSLVDFAPIGSTCRGIDGIVLTKFDTMDDKVGAAVSMVYELGQPIVFVGVGQTYQDLKVIEPEVVVSALMK